MDACRYDGIWKICLKVHTITQKTHARTQALDRKYKHLDYMMASPPPSSSPSPSSSHHEHYRQLLFGGGFGISPPFMLLGPCTFYCPPTLPLYLAQTQSSSLPSTFNNPYRQKHISWVVDQKWHFESRCHTPNASHAISRCHFRLIRRQILVISQNFPIPKSFS